MIASRSSPSLMTAFALIALAASSLSPSRTLVAAWANDGSVIVDICPNNCEPNGVCLDEGKGCRCNSGFVGADCAFPLTMCPDNKMACYNGATCLDTGGYHNEQGAIDLDPTQAIYECDCAEAFSESAFAGSQCQHAISDYCAEPEDDASSSNNGYDVDPDKAATNKYAFCTNGGSCMRRIETYQPHPGCHCIGGYEGRHCQYRKGTAPPEELQFAAWDAEQHAQIEAAAAAAENNNSDKSGSNTAGIISSMVIIAVVVIVVGLMVVRIRQKQARNKDASLAALRNDLGMDANESAENGKFHDVPIGQMG